MKHDIIVIGAGIGGLSCASRLAEHGKKVLVLEKNRHIGGTSYIFRRHGYGFPMGPLSFSFPQLVQKYLSEVGAGETITFKRNHFQLVSPGLELIYSSSLEETAAELKRIFPQEKSGLDSFLNPLRNLISLTKDLHEWHPDYQTRQRRNQDSAQKDAFLEERANEIRQFSETPCSQVLDRLISNRLLKDFLGSQSTSEPEMSMLNLAFTWNMISEVGIWSPSCGIHGLSERLRDVVVGAGGEVKLGCPVDKIIIERGKAIGVRTGAGENCFSAWVVSNADYKKTFLELIHRDDCPPDYLNRLSRTPYTGSEICVYLGINPSEVDFTRMKANHLFYRHNIREVSQSPSHPEDFENRDIEICLWTENSPGLAPPGKASLILRAGFPYDHFAHFRIAEKRRKDGYLSYKTSLARRLIQTAEHILPGLSAAAEVIEIATPLTYRDWGQRTRGSIAGWTWSAGHEQTLGRKLLIETPVENLLMAGIYAASELFLGGVPTALHTGRLAADIILANVPLGATS